MTTTHRAGFVHIVGRPNAGKSTLMNGLVKYPLSIATHKPQTTRQNIVGIDQAPSHQIIYIDTPGYLTPKYALHKAMMHHVNKALLHGDILLWIADIQQIREEDTFLHHHLTTTTLPAILVLNKIDVLPPDQIDHHVRQWRAHIPHGMSLMPMSALNPYEVNELSQRILAQLPIHPPYYDKETLTDRPLRHVAADLLRKAIFLYYQQEIPYSTEVIIETWIDQQQCILVNATLYVERPCQKRIIIGKNGQALKHIGTQARQALETLVHKPVFLTQHVKVLPHWRRKKTTLTTLGHYA